MPVRMLITGASGFVGRHLVRDGLSHGDELHALILPGEDHGLPDAVTTHQADLLAADDMTKLIALVDPEAVVHLAGEASVGRSFGSPERTWRVNVGGTLAVLEALRRNQSPARGIIITSGEIYGLVPVAELPVGVHTPLAPNSPYAASKAAADLMTGQYEAAYGLDLIRVRAFNQIGPGQDARFVLPTVARQIAEAEIAGRSEVVVSVGNVSSRRDFTDVRDTARAYRLMAAHGRSGAVYHLCSGRSVAVSELVDALARHARIPTRVVSDPAARREGEQPDLYGNPKLLAEHTGWRPEIDLEDTVRDTLDWWRDKAGAIG